MSALPFRIAPSQPHAPARKPTASTWGADVKRILCVRLDRLGDLLMTTPAFHALRESVPGRHLTLLTSSVGAQAAPFLRDIDEVIAYDAPWHGLAPSPAPRDDLAMRELLASREFDAAVIFTVYSQSPLPAALLCHLSGIARRLAHCRENPYDLLTDWVPEEEPHAQMRHEAERQLALVGSVGAATRDPRMRFDVVPEAHRMLVQRLTGLGLDPQGPWAVLHPGASAPSRRYPPERFGEVAARLVQATDWPILLTGTPEERALIKAVVDTAGPGARSRLHDLSGLLSLGELAALIERATVLIANNSGPVHLASALGTPVVDLYALTNPQHTPWMTANRVLFHDVDCRWCYRGVCPQGHHACLLGVPAAEVATAAVELAAGRSRSATAGARAAAAGELGAPAAASLSS